MTHWHFYIDDDMTRRGPVDPGYLSLVPRGSPTARGATTRYHIVHPNSTNDHRCQQRRKFQRLLHRRLIPRRRAARRSILNAAQWPGGGGGVLWTRDGLNTAKSVIRNVRNALATAPKGCSVLSVPGIVTKVQHHPTQGFRFIVFASYHDCGDDLPERFVCRKNAVQGRRELLARKPFVQDVLDLNRECAFPLPIIVELR